MVVPFDSFAVIDDSAVERAEARRRAGIVGSMTSSFDFKQTVRQPLYLNKRTCPTVP